MSQRRPRVIAHRGASAVEPEHTLRAYRRAIEMGADGVECDVRLTRDGVLVCIHDRTVDRTSNGTGVVSTLTLADLHRLDFGSWRGQPADVLTLQLLLEALLVAGRPTEIAIETKHPTRFGGRVEREVVAMLARMGVGSDRSPVTARVMSFSPPAVASVRRLAPGVATVQLMQRIPAGRRDGSLWAGATIAGPSLAAVKAYPDYVERAHASGHEVHVWTVDDVADVAYLAGLGVDAVITNRPDAAIAALSP
ncbi:MAG TPA: glycerophosphodiester phosphodiesterase family protein [Mycobacteriales bacterium]|nr:glycerophosphodiester phosphodiesterase family protein [Mycobacteriales bacterium]